MSYHFITILCILVKQHRMFLKIKKSFLGIKLNMQLGSCHEDFHEVFYSVLQRFLGREEKRREN